MRTTTLSVHNNQYLQIYARSRSDSPNEFEVWMVGNVKGQDSILNHFLTQDDYEEQLAYIHRGDLVWEDSDSSAIPSNRTQYAFAMEESFERGVHQNDVRLCCYIAIRHITTDRKALNVARKSLLGRWSDGVVTLHFKGDSKFEANFSVPASHHHFLYAAVNRDRAAWWNLSSWWLLLMNEERMQGQKMGLWKCEGDELHLFSDQQDVLVHVFRRVSG